MSPAELVKAVESGDLALPDAFAILKESLITASQASASEHAITIGLAGRRMMVKAQQLSDLGASTDLPVGFAAQLASLSASAVTEPTHTPAAALAAMVGSTLANKYHDMPDEESAEIFWRLMTGEDRKDFALELVAEAINDWYATKD
jgi:hypothetical protein